MIKIKSDKIIVNEELFNGYVYIEDDKIVKVCTEDVSCDAFYDFTGKYVCAGFIETHTHGAGGHAFINSTVSDVIKGCDYHLEHGTTCIVPTVTTADFSIMKQAVINIDKAKKSKESKATILGAHLEGPYLSVNQCGAQSGSCITEPIEEDYKALIEEYGDSVIRWSYAPERDFGGKFCKYLTEHGVLPSAGHTDAKLSDMIVAIENGCKLVTHFYSCTSTITRSGGFRSLGVIESAYLKDELYVELIADGKHLPPELIQMIIKIKGTDKVILTTDSLEIAGTSIKDGVMSGVEFIVEDGVCKLKDRSAFAGSVATQDRLVRTLVNDCGFSIPTAVKMLTKIPAKLLNVNKGEIAKGKDADIVVFDDDIRILDVFVLGKKVK